MRSMIRGLMALAVGLALAGCLSEPSGVDCAETPEAAGCLGGGPDGGEPIDARADGDRGPGDGPPPDAPPDAPEIGPPDAALADGGPDAALDAGPDAMPDAALPACERRSCPAPPFEAGCIDDQILLIDDPWCAPAACTDAEIDCEPGQLACRAFVGCLLWCLVGEPREDCEAVCTAEHLEGDPDATARFEALNACLNDAECPEGPEAAACQADACPEALAGCVGDIGRVWFVRPPFAQGAIRCDYPIDAGQDCGAAGQTCRQGACVDAVDPCDPSPCADRPLLRCEADAVVESAPPTCRVEGEEAVCDYAEERRPCEPEPARCAGDILIESHFARCVDDVQGVYCQADSESTNCAIGAVAARCEGNVAVETPAGRCVGGDATPAACEAPAQQRVACDARGNLCHQGECVASACETTCEDRNALGCTRDQTQIRVRCTREQYCTGGACTAIPEVHGTACRDQNSTAACTNAGLFCRGFAAVPMCLLGQTPRTGRQNCWTSQDCLLGNLCTRNGTCSSGAAGSACEDDLDCADGTRCGRGGTCQ